MNNLPETSFDFSGGIGDIGTDDIDLKGLNLDMTDTLIGSAMNELTAALGEADSNPYEAYHQGDGGISDIVLTTFDSALLIDGGIKPYTEDPEAETSTFDDAKELANSMGKEIPKEEDTNKIIDMSVILRQLDKVTNLEVNNDKMPWTEYKVFDFNADGDLVIVDDEEEFTDEDFEEADKTFFDDYDDESLKEYEDKKIQLAGIY
jgi:hypothetical protein